MEEDDFKAFWKRKFGETLPLGYKLRSAYKKRWFRVHSLPAGQRYAQTEEEYQVILDRQNALIGSLIGESKPLIILFCLFKNDVSNENYYALSDIETFNRIPSFPNQIIQKSAGLPPFEVFIKAINWEKAKYDAILRGIADDEIQMLFISVETSLIIAPYDGGVDIIMPTEEEQEKAKEAFQKWQPNTKLGL